MRSIVTSEYGDIPGAGADEGVADQQAGAHMPLGIGQPMGRAVGAEPAGLRQGAGVPAVGLHLPRASRVHGREVGVGHDDLVAQSLQAAGYPFALGRRLEHDPPPGPRAEHGGEPRGLGADPLLEQFAPLRQDADLTFLLVHVDANMVHGWPPSPCARERVIAVGQSMPPRRVGGQPLHPIYAHAPE